MRPFPSQLLCAAALALAAGAGPRPAPAGPAPPPEDRPNILWLTCEDMGPHIGPYGDRYADTPNLDRFAGTALRYDFVWSNAPVCAPARTTLITGMYCPGFGAEHMRSQVPLPPGAQLFPALLRRAGYFTTNNVKTDYNLPDQGASGPDRAWDQSSNRAHWRARPAGKPFFAVFNSTVTHESQIRRRPHQLVHDPARAPIPPYHPDRPEVRRDWAQYYDNVTAMDREVGARLQELEEAGLADSTIVFYFSDHGSGMPRSKRTPCDSGLRVPLLVRIPPRYRHLAPPDYRPGGATARLAGFVDFAPTVLRLAGLRPPAWMQGTPFLGRDLPRPPEFLHGFRGRMDERVDLVRSVTDGRYVYLRNFLPHLPHGQHVSYQFETPTTRVWKELYDAGRLTAAQSRFWQPREPEELYDLRADPYELRSLARDPAHRAALERLRAAQRDHALRIGDLGLLPEGEMHRRAGDGSPAAVAGIDFRRLFEAADQASRGGREGRVAARLRDPDAAIRYWAALGLRIRGEEAVRRNGGAIEPLLEDPSPSVRIAAADCLARWGDPATSRRAIEALLEAADFRRSGIYDAVAALNVLDGLGSRLAPYRDRVKALPTDDSAAPPRARGYLIRLQEKILAGPG